MISSATAVLTVLHQVKVVHRPKLERTLRFAIVHINSVTARLAVLWESHITIRDGPKENEILRFTFTRL